MEKYDPIEHYEFESREAYDRAKKEAEFIKKARTAANINDGKNALKLYNKLVSEKLFTSVIGYEFLLELRDIIEKSGVSDRKSLAHIPVREIIKTDNDTLTERSAEVERFKRQYEGQKLLNKKVKIALAACIIMLAGFVVVNFRLEYSIFTYFTNYKANMEDELINKYENWSDELQKREDALNGGKSVDE